MTDAVTLKAPPERRRTRSDCAASLADVRVCEDLDACALCGTAVWWRRPGGGQLRYWFCAPPRRERGVEVFIPPDTDTEIPELGDLLAELGRPTTVAALKRAAQEHPEIGDYVLKLMECATLASAAGDEETYKATAAGMIAVLHDLRMRDRRRLSVAKPLAVVHRSREGLTG